MTTKNKPTPVTAVNSRKSAATEGSVITTADGMVITSTPINPQIQRAIIEALSLSHQVEVTVDKPEK
jgi:hypothetical protein